MPWPIAIPPSDLGVAHFDVGRLPQTQLGFMRPRVVAPRDEGRLGGGDFLQCVNDVLVAGDVCRIALRSSDDEIVVHDVVALHALSFGHELVLGWPVVNEDHVRIAPPPDVERLAGAHRDHFHVDALGLRELRQQVTEKPRLLGRRRRGDRDGTLLSLSFTKPQHGGKDDCGNSHRYVSSSCTGRRANDVGH
jgi:hypothetical protein